MKNLDVYLELVEQNLFRIFGRNRGKKDVIVYRYTLYRASAETSKVTARPDKTG